MPKKWVLKAATAAVALSGFATANDASAQTATQSSADPQTDASESTSGRSAGNIESSSQDPQDIVVTARRFAERLQSTPIAVTAVSGGDLQQRSAVNALALAQITPSLTATVGAAGSSNNASFFIRGVGQAEFLPTADPGVGVYLDGVYIARSTGSLMDLSDIAQIEVLRGPQGTLFGKNTSGGAISMTTKRPDGTVGATGQVRVANYGTVEGRISAQGALIPDQIALSATMLGRISSGYGKNLNTGNSAGDTNLIAGRLSLNYIGSSTFSYYLSGDYSHDSGSAQVPHPVGILPTTLVSSYLARVYGPGAVFDKRYITRNVYATYGDPGQFSKLASGGVSGIGTLDLGDLTLKSITAYRGQHSDTYIDLDGSPYVIGHYRRNIHQSQFSQELQASGKLFGDALKYVFGAYYLHEDVKLGTTTRILGGNYAALIASGVTRENATDTETYAFAHQKTDSYAGYANLILQIAEGLSISGGLRYSVETKDIEQRGYQLNRLYSIYRDASNSAFSDPNLVIEAKRTFKKLTPAAGIQYQATPNAFFYASYAQGYKGGGFDGRPILGLQTPSAFSPEQVTSYEVGTKLDLFGRLLRLNVAAFHMDFTNIQVNASTLQPNGILTNVVRNAGQAKIDGVEVESLLRPVQGLEIAVNASYNNSRFTRVSPGVTFSTADHPTYTPKWIINPSVQYRIDLGDESSLTARVDYSYRSTQFMELPNTYGFNASGQPVVNGPFDLPTKQPCGSACKKDPVSGVIGV
ncbi:TonB-dependent receptor [Sphingobium yanoikuyae]|uniref:TonB-dependent receptor n=1 Tax=Sphingobium yanoikuyae TaxID=13690 RepID=A0A430BRG5_SPHYA|nr:TonB-dependent receptor [Sphingobium yanoikuyae]RSU55311.1 TonB-dependent receptor [Sphingobium yanoikuyae]